MAYSLGSDFGLFEIKNLFKLLIFIFVISSCQAPSSEEEETQDPKDFAELTGTWSQNTQGLYHTIYVQDSMHIVLDTHIDTMISYTYRLQTDTLFLYNEYGNQVNYNLILKLTDDSLIFENLLDRVGIQKYARKKNAK